MIRSNDSYIISAIYTCSYKFSLISNLLVVYKLENIRTDISILPLTSVLNVHLGKLHDGRYLSKVDIINIMS